MLVGDRPPTAAFAANASRRQPRAVQIVLAAIARRARKAR